MADDERGARCRFCNSPLRDTFVDLGMSPLCETFPGAAALNRMEPFYPLHVWVCRECFLVQLEEYVAPEIIFDDTYPYFSSYSDSWVDHARRYVDMVVERFALDESSRVVEVASNDGYLLQHFVARGIPSTGVEPTANTAQVAIDQGIPTIVRFFGSETARDLLRELGPADLVLGNNVLAHTPALNDFVEGVKILLSPGGVTTFEFPHLFRLIAGNQFDTIYHEHFSYFSFFTVEKVFAAHGLTLFDVEQLPTHGGSLRIFGRHDDNGDLAVTTRVEDLRTAELQAGVTDLGTYASFGEQVQETKSRLLDFLITARREGKSVAAYGAPGKGNTLLNYCGIREDFVSFAVDRNPHKHGRFTPGTHIPIHPPETLVERRPDYVLILPWNLRAEIVEQNAYIRDWGGKFVVPIPEVEVIP
jgi:C-methyltransferase C-terminal domain/Putative zinc binding domain/Methyltransferase domain